VTCQYYGSRSSDVHVAVMYVFTERVENASTNFKSVFFISKQRIKYMSIYAHKRLVAKVQPNNLLISIL
jgi:hypothetical protein